jgi:hypothetical protein
VLFIPVKVGANATTDDDDIGLNNGDERQKATANTASNCAPGAVAVIVAVPP